jgi:hypothetical protein
LLERAALTTLPLPIAQARILFSGRQLHMLCPVAGDCLHYL